MSTSMAVLPSRVKCAATAVYKLMQMVLDVANAILLHRCVTCGKEVCKSGYIVLGPVPCPYMGCHSLCKVACTLIAACVLRALPARLWRDMRLLPPPARRAVHAGLWRVPVPHGGQAAPRGAGAAAHLPGQGHVCGRAGQYGGARHSRIGSVNISQRGRALHGFHSNLQLCPACVALESTTLSCLRCPAALLRRSLKCFCPYFW